MRLVATRRNRISRAIFAVVDPHQPLGIEFQQVPRGSYTFPFRLRDGRVFEAHIGVSQTDGRPSFPSSYNVPDTVREFGESLPASYFTSSLTFQDDQGSFQVTGRGDATEIFSKVAAVVNQFLQANPQVASISFTGSKESRVRLYKRLSRMMSGDIGYVSDISPSGSSGSFVVPNRYFSVEAANQAVVQAPPAPPAPPQYTSPEEDDDEDEERSDEDIQQDWDDAQERYNEELESHLDYWREAALGDETQYQRNDYAETYEDERREEYKEEITDQLYQPMVRKYLGDPRQKLLPGFDTPQQQKEALDALWEKAEEQAEDMVEVEWTDRWEAELDSMDEQFEEQARESIEENSVPYWREQWEADHNVEDYLE